MGDLITPVASLVVHPDRSRSLTFAGTTTTTLRPHSPLLAQTTRSTQLQAAHPSRVTWDEPFQIGTTDDVGVGVVDSRRLLGLDQTYDSGDLVYCRILGCSVDTDSLQTPDLRSQEAMVVVPSIPTHHRRMMALFPTYSVDQDLALLDISSAASTHAAAGSQVHCTVVATDHDGATVDRATVHVATIGKHQVWDWTPEAAAIALPHRPGQRLLASLHYVQRNGTPIGTGLVPAQQAGEDSNVIHRPHWPLATRR